MSLKKLQFDFNQKENQTKELVVATLTNREFEIIKLAAESLTNKEIATKLFIDEKTCKKHRENAYKLLNISGKEEVRIFLRWAKENIL